MAANALEVDLAIATRITLIGSGAKATWMYVRFRPRILQRILERPYVPSNEKIGCHERILEESPTQLL